MWARSWKAVLRLQHYQVVALCKLCLAKVTVVYAILSQVMATRAVNSLTSRSLTNLSSIVTLNSINLLVAWARVSQIWQPWVVRWKPSFVSVKVSLPVRIVWIPRSRTVWWRRAWYLSRRWPHASIVLPALSHSSSIRNLSSSWKGKIQRSIARSTRKLRDRCCTSCVTRWIMPLRHQKCGYRRVSLLPARLNWPRLMKGTR